ncbi:MAG: glucitol/sorbitol system component, partial [Clostridiales bacterium]|nr:glucitol/sorbitol system component [Clostridiales bacterium]
EIIAFGPLVEELLENDMMIIFNENAPAELAEISVLHTMGNLKAPIEKGDVLTIGEHVYRVTCVGEEANKTLDELGHCTLKFDGADEPDLPGTICLGGAGVPEAKIGDIITIQKMHRS